MQNPSAFTPVWRNRSIVMAILAISLGLVGLSGWIVDSYRLRSFMSDGATMKADTALLIIALGTSLLLFNYKQERMAKALTMLVALFCMLVLTEHIGNINLGIDEWWFKDRDSQLLLEAPGRTSAITAINILLIDITLILAYLKKHQFSQLLAALVFLLVYASLLGHLFGVAGFYRQGRYSGMAFHTAISMLFLNLSALFYQAHYAWMRAFVRSLSGRNIIIYLFSYFLCAAPLLVALYLYFIDHGTFSPASGVIVLTVISALISIPVAYLVLYRLNQMGNDLRQAHEKLEIAIEASDAGVWDLNLHTKTVHRSEQHAAIFGHPYTPSIAGDHIMEQFYAEDAAKVKTAVDHAITTGKLDLQVRILLPDKRTRWVQIYGKTHYNDDNQPARMLGTVMDISERKEVETKKDAFIGMVSHELKTPLTSFKSYVQLVLKKASKSDDDFAVNTLARAVVQANKMTAMIQGFLDVTRLDNGKLHLDKTLFEVYPLIKEMVEDTALLADGYHIMAEECQTIYLLADRNKIGQVLTNLLSNAVKYSPKATTISIKCEQLNGKVKISVTDQGVGIRDQDKDKLFDRFYRVERQEHQMVSGFGIGLYLSAEIIRLHEGKIGVENSTQKGSVFYFTLPAPRQK